MKKGFGNLKLKKGREQDQHWRREKRRQKKDSKVKNELESWKKKKREQFEGW